MHALEKEKTQLQQDLGSTPRRVGPKVTEADLRRVAERVTHMAEEFLAGDGEVLSELAPRFIHRFLVDKEKREITVEFFNVPGLRPSLEPETGTRIDRMEAAGVEPASETARPEPLRA
jgi:hypothetical protein